MTHRSLPGWIKIHDHGLHGCGNGWAHESGWQVWHCGHPTANWPYFAAPPGYGHTCPQGNMLLTGGIGLGLAFRTLRLAQEAVERVIAGERPRHWKDVTTLTTKGECNGKRKRRGQS